MMKHAFLFAALVLSACRSKQELTAPPPPLRPEAAPTLEAKPVAKDCDPIAPDDELKPISFDERSIPEGQKLADQARGELKAAETAESDRATREAYITDAVDHLITALRADPYNVGATYSLAAAYARIGRKQCSLNLLTRMMQMRPHASKHAEVEAQLDKLLGRKQVLDPDFADMRGDSRFRTLIQKMCEGTNDANCVYGSSQR
ncbi:MAG: hypothetical protein SFX73_24345 [Kofleriaceae bacterium]|nr:hypothetical protein [Kofleriaceae bacterium]